MLSQKYYKMLAKVFKNAYIESYKTTYETNPTLDNNMIGSHIANMQWELIYYLRKENPKFNEDILIKAMNFDIHKSKRAMDK